MRSIWTLCRRTSAHMIRVPSGGTRYGGNAPDVIETVFQRCRIAPRVAVSTYQMVRSELAASTSHSMGR